MEKVATQFDSLTDGELFELEKNYEQNLWILKALRAARRRHNQHQRTNLKLEKLFGLSNLADWPKAHIVRLFIEAGCSVDEAIAETAETFGMTKTTIRPAWDQYSLKIQKEQRDQRNRTIMRLARQGLSNLQIAGKTGISPGTVSKIIRKLVSSANPSKRHHRTAEPPDTWHGA